MDHEKYKDYYINKETATWKKLLDVQRPYRKHIQSLNLGFTLDLGCGLGRNLTHLNGNGVGVDVNEHMVVAAKTRGLNAFTPVEFLRSSFSVPERFDSILCSHVLEHMTVDEGVVMLNEYIKFLKVGGKVVLITPQERGYRSDPTHVCFVDDFLLQKIGGKCGLEMQEVYSFPFFRVVGKVFPHNEFVYIGRK